MDADRQSAYRFVLAAALLHLKWDLVCLYGGFSWRPRRFRLQARAARRAAHRAVAFHNLAIASTYGFAGFCEEQFWADVGRFVHDFPESRWSNYRGMFEAALRGEVVHVIAPGGGLPLDDNLLSAAPPPQ